MNNPTRSTLLLEVVTADGDARWHGLNTVEYQSTPPHTFADRQSGSIPVNIAHQTGPIGWVDYLECRPDSYNGALMAVAVVNADAELVDGLACSAEIRCDAMHTVELRSYRRDRKVRSYGQLTATRSILDGLGLVDSTAGVTSTRVQAFAGDYRDVCDWSTIKSHRPPSILDRAKAATTWERRSRRPDAVQIHRPIEPDYDTECRSGRLELRHGITGRILGVR